MQRTFILFFAVALGSPLTARMFSEVPATASVLQGQDSSERRLLNVPQRRQRRVRGDRRRGRGIGHAYGRAGRSAGRGGARFGKQIARGRPVRAGKEFGKGMGGFGKNTGVGTARVGKKIGKSVKRIFTP